jgi:vacuolar-type H+-ATPase subunit E/Vma4
MKFKETNFYKYFKDVINNNIETIVNDLEYNDNNLTLEERKQIIKTYKDINEENIDNILSELLYDSELEREINETLQYYIKRELGVEW